MGAAHGASLTQLGALVKSPQRSARCLLDQTALHLPESARVHDRRQVPHPVRRLILAESVVIHVIHEVDLLAVRLDPTTDERLTRLANETGRSKSYYVKQAIDAFLENREDYLLALSVLERDEPRKPIADVRRALGLDD